MIGFQVPPLFGMFPGWTSRRARLQLTSGFITPVDVELIGVGAHMHYLGHTAKATATLPDGTTKPLFYIDEWDFNWQNNYFTKTRSASSRHVKGVVTFDNSAQNPHNPFSPPRRVRGGSSPPTRWAASTSAQCRSMRATAAIQGRQRPVR